MKYKQIAIILKIIASLSFIVGIVSAVVAIFSIFLNPVFQPQFKEFLKSQVPHPVVQIVIPQSLLAIRILLQGILSGISLVCVARYLINIENEK